jgi:phage baseplate assembly protein W
MDLATAYSIPVRFDMFFTSGQLEQCSVQESIRSYIHLAIITSKGEYDFDGDFGCEVWDSEFEHQQTTRIWVEQLSRNIQELLENYERRLSNIKVRAAMSQVEFEHKEEFKVAKRLKKKLTIVFNANLASTDETFYFEDEVLLSPFATD